MHKLVVLVFVQIGLYSCVHGGWQVCFPDQMEGLRHELTTRRTAYFAIDYDVQRYYEAEDPASGVFIILDLEHGYLHSFQGGNCSSRVFETVRFFDQCVENEFGVPSLSLGELNHGLDVYGAGLRVHQTDKIVLVTGSDGHGLPFYRQTIDDNNRTMTTFFSEMTDSINRYNYIYTNTSICIPEDGYAYI